jgi:hypothetical protein
MIVLVKNNDLKLKFIIYIIMESNDIKVTKTTHYGIIKCMKSYENFLLIGSDVIFIKAMEIF